MDSLDMKQLNKDLNKKIGNLYDEYVQNLGIQYSFEEEIFKIFLFIFLKKKYI